MRPPLSEEPKPEAPQGPPPRRRFGLARRWLGAVLSPIANYVRRYLQASVEHELRETRAHLHAVSADLRGLELRLDQTLRQNERLAATLARLEAHAERLPGLFGPRFDELEIKLRPLIAYDEASMAIRMRDGYVLAPRALPTFVTMLANATSGGLEPGTGEALRRLVRPGMTVADVGANIGLLTLVMARATGPGGKVLAFEPEAVPRSNLEKMKYLNGLAWVDVRDQAVGDKAGRLTFHVSDIIGHSSLYALPEAEEARTIEVEVVRLDDAAPAKRMDVVKIDVEGAELDVLAGMQGLIGKNPDLAIVAEFGPEHLKRVGQTPAQWFKAFADAGFKPYLIDESTSACAPTDAKAAARLVSANIAFVRPGGDAERRLLQR
ncbi:FkbM family methyltransferase [Caulobacter sp.]|uniref:FkbM family methyltransferase n=1 Tax=Caulobacter sp. TaxID=78 RepID=UPI0039C89ED9